MTFKDIGKIALVACLIVVTGIGSVCLMAIASDRLTKKAPTGVHALKVTGASIPGPGLQQVTWGARTATIGTSSCILLDGGAATYGSDPVTNGGYIGTSESGAFFSCGVPGAAAVEDSFTAQVSNDGVTWATLASQNAGLADAGLQDAGVLPFSEIQVTAAAYSRLQLSHLAAQNAALCCTVNAVPR